MIKMVHLNILLDIKLKLMLFQYRYAKKFLKRVDMSHI